MVRLCPALRRLASQPRSQPDGNRPSTADSPFSVEPPVAKIEPALVPPLVIVSVAPDDKSTVALPLVVTVPIVLVPVSLTVYVPPEVMIASSP